MSDRPPACVECLGTGWACQPPRCHHPVHVVCPWCGGTGDSSNPVDGYPGAEVTDG